jgi:hypothetical protein
MTARAANEGDDYRFDASGRRRVPSEVREGHIVGQRQEPEPPVVGNGREDIGDLMECFTF